MSSQYNNTMPSFLTMSFETVTVRLGKADEAVDIPVNLELLKAVSPYFVGAFEGGFREAIDRKIELMDVSEQTFRIFLQWAHAQLYSSGREVPIPDLSILGRSTQEGPNTTPHVPDESGDNEEEDNSDNNSDDDSEHDSDDRSDDGFLGCYCRCGNRLIPPSWTSSGRSSRPLIDENPKYCYQSVLEKRKVLYFNNMGWKKNFDMAQMSYLNVFIFADKYNVDQLRDDILTALVVQFQSWHWSPAVNQDLLALSYGNLPDTSPYHKFMVQMAAHIWLLAPTHDPDLDVATRLCLLREWRPEFAFEVVLAQALILQKSRVDGKLCHYETSNPNSCVFHEHVGHDQATCRKRIKEKAHIFTTLIEACSKDGLSMVKEDVGIGALANLSISCPAS